MRLGLYISPAHAVPPQDGAILAPWRLVAALSDGLVQRKHQVTLFAAKGSKTNAHLVHAGIAPVSASKPSYDDSDAYRSFVIAQELLLFREVIGLAKAGKLDCIHIHQPVERLYPALAALPPKFPVIITFHDPITPSRFAALETLMDLGNIHLVALSQSQKRGVPFPFAGVVANGVDTTLFTPDTASDSEHGPLLMTGRIVPEKGFVEGIAVAKKTGDRLVMVGQPYLEKTETKRYFEEDVAPALDKKQIFLEETVKPDHLVAHYQGAKALLFPIHWEEPFGLVMIEAMACGTPVVAFNRGSVPEIVRDGVTGFVVDPKEGVDGFVAAVNRVGTLDRGACRSHVESHFSMDAMVDAYEKVYTTICR